MRHLESKNGKENIKQIITKIEPNAYILISTKINRNV